VAKPRRAVNAFQQPIRTKDEPPPEKIGVAVTGWRRRAALR
jgi:hypothetical protein